jgi:hypothetical protein
MSNFQFNEKLLAYGNAIVPYTILKHNASALKQAQFQICTLQRTRVRIKFVIVIQILSLKLLSPQITEIELMKVCTFIYNVLKYLIQISVKS